MRTRETRQRKQALAGLKATAGRDWMLGTLVRVIRSGKQALDAVMLEMGRMVAESVMLMEREEVAGHDYDPTDPSFKKWAYEKGSIYLGDQRVHGTHPRLRYGTQGEVTLQSNGRMRAPGAFSGELLEKILRGCQPSSTPTHRGVPLHGITQAGGADGGKTEGVSKALAGGLHAVRGVPRHHPPGRRGVPRSAGHRPKRREEGLGFWQGSFENHENCEALFVDLERRGLLKALRVRFGKKLLQQRCAIHKSRNLHRYLAKPYRIEAHRRLMLALEQTSYADARRMLLELEAWLRAKNESAADSLLEAFEELLTTHRLTVPALLRKTLLSTNPIESMFSLVRHSERNIRRSRGSAMLQRWLGTVLLYCEQQFNRVKGFAGIAQVLATIEAEQAETQSAPTTKAA